MVARETLAPVKRERLDTPRKPPRSNIYFAGASKGLRFIPSGCHILDLALGGGWVQDRIINVVGDRSTGKTLLCIEAAANFARAYAMADIFYRESEHAFDESYARALGMPMSRVDYSHSLETVEDWFEDLEHILSKRKRPALYIVDSLDALSDRAELKRDVDKDSFGTNKAKVLSQMFRRLTGELSRKHVTLFIVSQIRDRISKFGFGKTWVRSGGKALDFYSSQVLYLTHLSVITRTVDKIKRPVGILVNAKLDKNKVGLPFRNAEFEIQFGFGIEDHKASIRWLQETDAKWFGKRKPADVLTALRSGDVVLADEVREHVTERWYQIEQSFLPERGKYG